MGSGAPGSLGARTLRGAAWAYGSYLGGRLLVLVATAILARLLEPSEFGLVALALIFTGLMETVRDLGVNQALVLEAESEVEERAHTAWLASVAIGAGLVVLMAALSPLAALFFDEPGLVALLSVLGLNFLLRALGATHYALAQKRLDFRSRTAAEGADVVVRGLVGIALALAGAGAWSLVLGYLAGTAAMTTTLWLLVAWRPALSARRQHLRSLVRVGGTLTAVDVVAAAIANADYVFVGRVLGTSALGLYTLAFRLPELAIRNLAVVASQTLLPAFASVRGEALARAFLVSLRYTLIVSAPVAAGVCVLAEPLVLTLYGDRWLGAVDAMRVLAVYAFVSTVAIPAGTAYKATGRARVLLWLSVPRLLLLVASLWVFAGEGLVAVAACQAVGSGLLALASTVLASRLLGVRLRALAAAAWPALVAATALAGSLVPIERGIDPPALALATGLVAGGAVYLGALRLLAPSALSELLTRLRAPRADPPPLHPPEGHA